MADITSTVDPDDGGADYASLNAWEAQNIDLPTATNTETADCSAASSSADTTATEIAGWTTSSTYDITIQQASSDRHAGIWSDSIYRLALTAVAASTRCIKVEAEFVSIDGLQLKVTASADNGHANISSSSSLSTASEIFIDDCICVGVMSGTAGSSAVVRGIWHNNESDMSIRNTLIYGWNPSTYGYGIQAERNSTDSKVWLWNCTLYDCEIGVLQLNDSVVKCTNTLIRNTTTAFSGSYDATSDYNSSDDSTASSLNNTKTTDSTPWNNSGDADTNYFTNAGAEDFRQAASDLSIDVGVDTAYTTDCVGTTRTSSEFDLGFFEFVAAGGLSMAVAMHHYTKNIGG